MRVHRVLHDRLAPGEQRLGAEASHHLMRVLRVGVGAQLELFDGRGAVAPAVVVALDDALVTVRVEPPAQVEPLQSNRTLTLGVALLKGDKLADVVRMGTELGVHAFMLVIAQRCDTRSVGVAKLARLQRIAQEAARQSGRAHVPDVHPPVALAALNLAGSTLVADPGAAVLWRDAPERLAETLTVLTGPEGGWSHVDLALLQERGVKPVRFPTPVVRAETAPVAVAGAWALAGGA